MTIMNLIPPVDDTTLLIQITASNQLALSELYNRYAPIIYSIALNDLQSVEESEDVVLETFTQVWQIAHHYDPTKSRADAWLFMLAHSRVVDRLRKLQLVK